LTKPPVYLLDVNILIASVFESHEHYALAEEWLKTPDLQWAVSPWSEAGFLRFAMSRNALSMGEASSILDDLAQLPGYHYHATTQDWRTLTKPFFRRLHGHKQVTDSYLLGMAIYDGLILATFDKRILHVAGEYSSSVHIVGAK
jgi:uncharacterized protein